MNNGLNIPLTYQTTRRGPWRVVWMLSVLLAVIFGTWAATRLVTTIDSTGAIRPTNATETVQILKTGRTVSRLSNHIGHQQVFFGQPWTYNDIFSLSKHQFALHYAEGELLAITIDNKLSEDTKRRFLQRSLHVQELGGRTVITSGEVSDLQSGRKRIQLGSVFPGFSGTVSEYREQDSPLRSALFVTKYGVRTSKNSQLDVGLPEAFPISDSLRVLAYYSVSDVRSSNFLSRLSPHFADLLNFSAETGAIMLAGEDQEGLALYIRTKTDKSIEDLAVIGQDIINRSSLQQTSFVLEDGTRVSELRARRGSITSDLSAGDQVSTISLQNTDGDVLRISKSDDIVIITNRETATESDTQPVSACRRSLNYFVRPNDLISAISEPHLYAEMSGSSLDLLFSEIAFGKRNTYYCW